MELLCKSCNQIKDCSGFYKNPSSRSGYKTICKKCLELSASLIKEKECSLCKNIKSADQFHKKCTSPSGTSTKCKDCASLYRTVHYQNNKERVYLQVKEYRKNNPDKGREWTAAWRDRNPEKDAELARKWREDHREAINEASRERNKKPEEKIKRKQATDKYLSDPVNKEKRKASNRRWGQNNKDKVCYYASNRRARKLQATPPWADQEIIKSFYTEANYFGDHVDHIIPLVHPLVCGLHCEFNLQSLSPSDNLSKNNKFEICEHEIPEYLGEEYHD